MTNYNLGYACINTALTSQKPKISTNRTMRKKTFQEKGLDYVSEIILQNVTDLLAILEWNAKHDIHFFRMSSEIFPWASEYDLEDLKDFDAIEEALFNAGFVCRSTRHSPNMSPGSIQQALLSKGTALSSTLSRT